VRQRDETLGIGGTSGASYGNHLERSSPRCFKDGHVTDSDGVDRDRQQSGVLEGESAAGSLDSARRKDSRSAPAKYVSPSRAAALGPSASRRATMGASRHNPKLGCRRAAELHRTTRLL